MKLNLTAPTLIFAIGITTAVGIKFSTVKCNNSNVQKIQEYELNFPLHWEWNEKK